MRDTISLDDVNIISSGPCFAVAWRANQTQAAQAMACDDVVRFCMIALFAISLLTYVLGSTSR